MGRRRLYPIDPRTGTTDAARQAACRQRKRQAARQAKIHRAWSWTTPPDLFHALDQEFHFMLDVAAQPNNALCDRFYTPEQDGLAQPWDGVVWCNPLYTGTGVLARWVQKAHESAQAGATTVCLLPVSTSAQWWQTYIRPLPLADVWMLPRRLKFGGAKNNAWFSSAVVIFRPPCQKES